MIRRRECGFTIVELMITLVVVGILAVLAIPAFGDQLARRRLEGAATDMSVDLQYARTQAVSIRGQVRVRTTSTATYVIDDSSGAPVYKSVTLPTGISVTNGVTITYDQLRGMANASSLALASAQTSATMQVDVNVMGRVSLCSPGGSLKGYTTC